MTAVASQWSDAAAFGALKAKANLATFGPRDDGVGKQAEGFFGKQIPHLFRMTTRGFRRARRPQRYV